MFGGRSLLALEEAKNFCKKPTMFSADWTDMTKRAFTTLFTGPGATEWLTRLLAKVSRTFGPSKAAPDMNETNVSGACGLSMNSGFIGESGASMSNSFKVEKFESMNNKLP